MKWLKPRPSKKAIVLLAAVAVGEVAATTAVFLQQQAAYARASATLAQKQREREESTRLAARLAGTEEMLQRDRERLRFLEAGVPRAAYVPTLLQQIEKLASSTQNRVLSIRPSLEAPKKVTKKDRQRDPEADEKAAKNPVTDEKQNQPYDRLTIQLQLEGSYTSTQRFVERLTRFEKIMAVEGLSLRPRPQKEEGGHRLSADLTVVAYIWKGEPAPTTPGAGQTDETDPGGTEEV